MSASLIVNEICHTIQGEGAQAGRPCALIRLTGCNLRCKWCDTQYAYHDGTEMSLDQVVGQVGRIGCRLVLVTGGEPLVQPRTPALLRRLCRDGYEVLLETNGSVDISAVDERAVRCVDVKCPGSGQAESMLWSNLEHLRPRDEVKFILAGREDYQFARRVVRDYNLSSRCTAVMTPAAGLLAPATLAEWILADGLDVRLGLQIHKFIWPDAGRGV